MSYFARKATKIVGGNENNSLEQNFDWISTTVICDMDSQVASSQVTSAAYLLVNDQKKCTTVRHTKFRKAFSSIGKRAQQKRLKNMKVDITINSPATTSTEKTVWKIKN